MVVVPGGEFRMGSEDGFENEKPVRTVAIHGDHRASGKAFAIAVYELRHKEYRTHANQLGIRSTPKGCRTYEQEEPSDDFTWRRRVHRHWEAPGYSGENDEGSLDNYPVVCVSWEDASRYARSMGEETAGGFRLLSEAEWEYVARGGNPVLGGVERRHASSAVGVEGKDNGGGPNANEFGVYGMLGNVWEWVEDCWWESYDDAPNDHSPRVSPGCQLRVLRGGSWADREDSEIYLRSAMRGRSNPELRTSFTGFRVAQDLDRDWVDKSNDWYLPDGLSCRPTYFVLSVNSSAPTGNSSDIIVEVLAELVDEKGRSLAAAADTAIALEIEGASEIDIPPIIVHEKESIGTVSFGLTPSSGQPVTIVGKGSGLVVNTVDLDWNTTQDPR